MSTINMLAPGATSDFTVTCRTGNTYTSNAGGVISGVGGSDIIDLEASGCTALVGAGDPWVTGQFYGTPKGVTPVALLTITATLYAYPIIVPNSVTVASLNMSVTTGQTGGAGHFGIYADNGKGYPGALEVESGAQTMTSSSSIATKSGLSTSLTPGVYWLASIFTATGTYPSVAGTTVAYTNELANQLGFDTAAHALATSGEAGGGITVAGTYGALPATFTSGATLNLGTGIPLIAVGV